jgi:hypothetical protein
LIGPLGMAKILFIDVTDYDVGVNEGGGRYEAADPDKILN